VPRRTIPIDVFWKTTKKEEIIDKNYGTRMPPYIQQSTYSTYLNQLTKVAGQMRQIGILGIGIWFRPLLRFSFSSIFITRRRLFRRFDFLLLCFPFHFHFHFCSMQKRSFVLRINKNGRDRNAPSAVLFMVLWGKEAVESCVLFWRSDQSRQIAARRKIWRGSQSYRRDCLSFVDTMLDLVVGGK
jgi:hypothetical protein